MVAGTESGDRETLAGLRAVLLTVAVWMTGDGTEEPWENDAAALSMRGEMEEALRRAGMEAIPLGSSPTMPEGCPLLGLAVACAAAPGWDTLALSVSQEATLTRLPGRFFVVQTWQFEASADPGQWRETARGMLETFLAAVQAADAGGPG